MLSANALYDSLTALVASTVESEGRIPARVMLRDLYMHRLIMPRDWFDNLDSAVRSGDLTVPEPNSFHGPVISHLHHEMAHGIMSAWPGYPVARELTADLVSPVIPMVGGGILRPGTMLIDITIPSSGVAPKEAIAAAMRRDHPDHLPQQWIDEVRLADELVADLTIALADDRADDANALLEEVDWACSAVEKALNAKRDVTVANEAASTMLVLSMSLVTVGQPKLAYAWGMRAVSTFKKEFDMDGSLGEELTSGLRHLTILSQVLGETSNCVAFAREHQRVVQELSAARRAEQATS